MENIEVILDNGKGILEYEVIQYMIENELNDGKTRKKYIVDPRDFLINILYYKFNWSESKIGDLIKRDHSSINHCKNKAYTEKEETSYISNTLRVRMKFHSWTPPRPEAVVTTVAKSIWIDFAVDVKEYEKLLRYKEKLDVKLMSTAVRNFIFNHIDEHL